MRCWMLAAVLTACDPTAPAGVPCGDGGACPSGQSCNRATQTCERAEHDTGGIDARGCEPGEVATGSGCAIPLDTAVAPAPLSAPGCNTLEASTSRTVAIDASNRIYVAYRCSPDNAAFVAVSRDGGRTTTQSLATAVDEQWGIEIAISGSSVIVAARAAPQRVVLGVHVF